MRTTLKTVKFEIVFKPSIELWYQASSLMFITRGNVPLHEVGMMLMTLLKKSIVTHDGSGS